MMDHSSTSEKPILRKHFRALRNGLSDQQQTHNSDALLKQFVALTQQYSPTKVAVFIANDGELAPNKITQYCWQHNIQTYLPVVDPNHAGHLLFAHYNSESVMTQNKYGIDEPDLTNSHLVDCLALEWVLMPLVAFTESGQRLGMGGGYYDRTFAMLKQNQSSKTQLIGIAHECQQASHLPVDAWDIAMRYILTPKRTIAV